MKSLRLISSSTIRPASDHDAVFGRIELIPCDLRFLLFLDIVFQRGLIYHKPRNESVIEHLKASLSRTLDIFYPLAGRLACVEYEDHTSSFFIDCNGKGVPFFHSALDGVTVADLLDPVIVPSDLIDCLFSTGGVFDSQGYSKIPLLAVQVTELVDGIFIACFAKHTVMDGTSFWHFFNTWSEISRSKDSGEEILSQPPPILDRSFFNGVFDLPIHLPLTQINTSNQNIIPQSYVVQPPLLQKIVLHFSKEKIAQLKAKANADMGTNKISSLQAIMGYIWVSITRNRCHNADQEVICFLTIGLRQRILQPPLPKDYFGNAILDQLVKCTAGELLRQGSSWAAWHINKTIASFSAAEALKSLQDWVKSLEVRKPGEMETSNPLLILSSSPRFNVYGNDFGWGRPLGVRSKQQKSFDGQLSSYPGAEEGSIDFEVCLLAETLQNMAKDADFTNTLAI